MFGIEEGPQFLHDHDGCIFLGRYKGPHVSAVEWRWTLAQPTWKDPKWVPQEEETDLYYYHRKGLGRTVISRFGNDGPAYYSGWPFSFGKVESLSVARMRTYILGHITWEEATNKSVYL